MQGPVHAFPHPIPSIDSWEVRAALESITPLCRWASIPLYGRPESRLHHITNAEPNLSLVREAQPGKRARGIMPLATITTFHKQDKAGFFDATIAEVVAQIPRELRAKAVAFETRENWEHPANMELPFKHGLYIGKTTLYVPKG